MTQAIADSTGLTPYVDITYSGLDQTSPWEQELLGSPDCYARHIELKAGDLCCLVARSIAVAGTDAANALETLGNRPLADLLFHADWEPGEVMPVLRNEQEYGRAVKWKNTQNDILLVQEFIRLEFAKAFTPSKKI